MFKICALEKRPSRKPHKLETVGSSPTGATSLQVFPVTEGRWWGVAKLERQHSVKVPSAGSSPAAPAIL